MNSMYFKISKSKVRWNMTILLMSIICVFEVRFIVTHLCISKIIILKHSFVLTVLIKITN